jgi:subtilisin family serine protease
MCSQYWAKPIVDPALRMQLLNKDDASIRVIAKFRDRDRGKMASQTGIQSQKIATSLVSQRQFIREMGLMKKGKIQRITSLWINNSIILEANVSLIRELFDRDDIELLSHDKEFRLEETVPYLGEDDPDPQGTTYGLSLIRAPRVWSELGITGKEVKVGVLDTGYAKHRDLKGKVIAARDFISGKKDNRPNDGQGHGTHVLGTIGGGDKSGKAIGVAPNVRFIVAKIFSDKGASNISSILRAMQWVADPDSNPNTSDHPGVISNSWGGKMKSCTHQKLMRDALSTWREMGIVPVFAAGNSGPTPYTVGFPGGFPEAIAVGAIDSSDKIAKFSSRGPVPIDGKMLIKPEITGPGVKILSAAHKGGYVRMSGTSMAAPHVSGVVALMLQAAPRLTPAMVSKILQETSRDLGEPGKDTQFGAGRLDAFRAVSRAIEFAQAQNISVASNAKGSRRDDGRN